MIQIPVGVKMMPLVIEQRCEQSFCMVATIEDGEFLFPDENIMEIIEDHWKLYFDGAANMKGYGVGMVLVSPNGDHIPLAVKLNYNSTNNTAEYEACIWV